MAKRLTAAEDAELKARAERASKIPPMRQFRVRVRTNLNYEYKDIIVSAQGFNLADADNGIVVFVDFGLVDYTPSGTNKFYRRVLWNVVDVEEIYSPVEPERVQ
jgi:hypothetical protein